MRRVLAAALVVSLAGCHRDGGGARSSSQPSGGGQAGSRASGDEIHYPTGPAAFDPSGPKPDVDVMVEGDPEFTGDKGELVVPLRVRNDRDKTIQVRLNQCVVELADGSRRPRVPPGALGRAFGKTDDILLAPGATKAFKLVFGGKNGRLTGSSFRVYLYANVTDGSGVVENLPVVVLGSGPFKKEAHPFLREKRAEPGPTTTDAPAPTGPRKTCGACGESMPADATACPTCGSR